jgi:hypothetical protein
LRCSNLAGDALAEYPSVALQAKTTAAVSESVIVFKFIVTPVTDWFIPLTYGKENG